MSRAERVARRQAAAAAKLLSERVLAVPPRAAPADSAAAAKLLSERVLAVPPRAAPADSAAPKAASAALLREEHGDWAASGGAGAGGEAASLAARALEGVVRRRMKLRLCAPHELAEVPDDALEALIQEEADMDVDAVGSMGGESLAGVGSAGHEQLRVFNVVLADEEASDGASGASGRLRTRTDTIEVFFYGQWASRVANTQKGDRLALCGAGVKLIRNPKGHLDRDDHPARVLVFGAGSRSPTEHEKQADAGTAAPTLGELIKVVVTPRVGGGQRVDRPLDAGAVEAAAPRYGAPIALSDLNSAVVPTLEDDVVPAAAVQAGEASAASPPLRDRAVDNTSALNAGGGGGGAGAGAGAAPGGAPGAGVPDTSRSGVATELPGGASGARGSPKRRRVEVVAPPSSRKYKYVTLSTLKVGSSQNNVYAVVVDVQFPRHTSGADEMSCVTVMDPSRQAPDEMLRLVVFAKERKSPATLSTARMGEIVRCHRVDLQEWGRSYQIMGKRASSFLVMRADGSRVAANDKFTFDQHDADDAERLRQWAAQRLHEATVFNPSFTISVEGLSDGRRGDLCVCVVAARPGDISSNGFGLQYPHFLVWDGTGDPTPSQSRLPYPPAAGEPCLGTVVHLAFAEAELSRFAGALRLTPGTWLRIRNARCKEVRDPERDESVAYVLFERNSAVGVLPDDSFDVRAKMEVYHERQAAVRSSIAAAPAREPPAGAGTALMAPPRPHVFSLPIDVPYGDAAAMAAAAAAAPEGTLVSRTLHPEAAPIRLCDVLKAPMPSGMRLASDEGVADALRRAAWFRCVVRVTGFSPPDVRDFVQEGPDGSLRYVFQLSLSDGSATLSALVVGKDAEAFLPGQVRDPCDLWRSNVSAQCIAECMLSLCCADRLLDCCLMPLPARSGRALRLFDTALVI